jgi:hypothetical protein
MGVLGAIDPGAFDILVQQARGALPIQDKTKQRAPRDNAIELLKVVA